MTSFDELVYTPGRRPYGGNLQTRLNQYIAQSSRANRARDVDIERRLKHAVQGNSSTSSTT